MAFRQVSRLKVYRSEHHITPKTGPVERKHRKLVNRRGRWCHRRKQARPGRQQTLGRVPERLQLIAEKFEGEPGVQLRVLSPAMAPLTDLVALDQVVVGVPWESKGFIRRVSTAGNVDSRRSGLVALRWCRSKSIRLWPSKKPAPSANSCKRVRALAKFRRVTLRVKHSPVSARTPAGAWMRPSLTPTPRSRDRQWAIDELARCVSRTTYPDSFLRKIGM